MTTNVGGPLFTADWFTELIPSWTTYVVPALAGRESVHWLEVGSYEGRSALWALDNILTGRGSTITCVDKWEGLWGQKCAEEKNFDTNVASRVNVVKLQGLSKEVLPRLPAGHFHGAYIDGSHEEAEVYRDAAQVLPLLRPGAFLIFDDYESSLLQGSWQGQKDRASRLRQFGVFEAANRILKELGPRVVVLHADWQLIARLEGAL
jgi:predicted O-methyltransferase YrrM